MRLPNRSQDCERARALVSTALDLDLNELESSFLHGHLGRCGQCRGFRAGAAALTAELRAAPLEAISRPVVMPSRRRRMRPPVRLAAAAAVVAIVGTATLIAPIEYRSTPPQAPAAPLRSSGDQELRQLLAYKESTARARAERGDHPQHSGPLNAPY